MKYQRGSVYISINQIDGFGKNPGLYIGTEDPNQAVKVASFGSHDKAQQFCKWLDYLLAIDNDREKVTWGGDERTDR